MPDYYSADQKLHWLSQPLAKINRSYKEKVSDDSHTNLYFDSISNRICGRWIKNNGGKYLMSLNLKDLSFELLDEVFNSVWLVSSHGKSIQEVEEQLDSGLKELGFNEEDWRSKMHYEIPDYGLNKNPIDQLDEEAVKLWSYYRSIANYACLDLLGNSQSDSEIRIWPHHFDTAIYFQLKPDVGIGFGLAMKDEMANDAYFYLSAYSDSLKFDFDKFRADSDWEWLAGDWQGAIIKLEKLAEFEHQAALKQLNQFSSAALEQYCSQLD